MYSEASKCGQAPTCTLRRTLYWESPFVMAEGTSLSGFGQTLGGSQVYKRILKNILPLVLFVLWLVVSAALPLALEAHGTVRSPSIVGWAGSQSGTTKPWMALLSAISANVEYVIFLGSVLLGTVIMVTIRRIFSTRRSASPRAILPCGSEDDFSTSL